MFACQYTYMYTVNIDYNNYYYRLCSILRGMLEFKECNKEAPDHHQYRLVIHLFELASFFSSFLLYLSLYMYICAYVMGVMGVMGTHMSAGTLAPPEMLLYCVYCENNTMASFSLETKSL